MYRAYKRGVFVYIVLVVSWPTYTACTDHSSQFALRIYDTKWINDIRNKSIIKAYTFKVYFILWQLI